MFEIPLIEQIEAVDREIALREKHYPRWIQQGKLTATAASLELARMRAVRRTLAGLVPEEPFGPDAKRNPVVAESVPQS